MKIIAKLVAFFLLGIVIIHIVFMMLQFATLWRSMVPYIAGPIIQSIALLIIVLAIQLLMQNNGEQKSRYLLVGLSLVIAGLVMAAMHYSIAPVGIRGYIKIGVPTFIAEFCLSVSGSRLGQRSSRKVQIIVGILLLTAALLIPPTLVNVFSYGE